METRLKRQSSGLGLREVIVSTTAMSSNKPISSDTDKNTEGNKVTTTGAVYPKPKTLGPDPDRQGSISFQGTCLDKSCGTIKIHWYSWGDPSNPCVIMIQGLSSHGWWGVCGGGATAERLVKRGFYVVSFDNRDVGLSTHFPDCPLPGPMMLTGTYFGIRGTTAGYSLDDMANDTIQLANGLGIEKFHLIGHSMGGMISQVIASSFPHRVISLTSMSTTVDVQGCPGAPTPSLRDLVYLRETPVAAPYVDEAGFEKWWQAGREALRLTYPTEPHFQWDEEGIKYMFRERNRRMGIDKDNIDRQLHAICCSFDRRPGLRALPNRIPVLIVHGTKDPVMPLENAITMQETVSHAKLMLIPHMKHVLPMEHYDYFVSEFTNLVTAAWQAPDPEIPLRTASDAVDGPRDRNTAWIDERPLLVKRTKIDHTVKSIEEETWASESLN